MFVYHVRFSSSLLCTLGVGDSALVGVTWDHTSGRPVLETGFCSSLHKVPQRFVWDVLYFLCSYDIRYRCPRCCNWHDELLRASVSVHPEMASFVLRSISCGSPSFRQRYSRGFRPQNLLHCWYIIILFLLWYPS